MGRSLSLTLKIFLFLFLILNLSAFHFFALAEEKKPHQCGTSLSLYPQLSIPDLRKNWMFYPYNEWSYQNINEVFPTAVVSKKDATKYPLKHYHDNINLKKITFKTVDNKDENVEQWLTSSNADGFIVLYNGMIAYENYYHTMDPYTSHQIFSATGAFIGNLASIYAFEKKIHLNKKVSYYLPKFQNTAYENVSLQDLLNMTVSLDYVEDYKNKSSDFYKYVNSITTADNGYPALREYLLTLKPGTQNKNQFHYASVNSEVLSWVLEEATGHKIQDLLSDRLWSKMGMEYDGYMVIDKEGVAWSGEGLNTTLRDAARFGQAMLQNGYFNGQQIIPHEVIEKIKHDTSKSNFTPAQAHLFPNFSYKNGWWISHDAHNSYMATGPFGQGIYVDPAAQLVIVKFSSLRELGVDDGIANSYRAMYAIANAFITHTISE